jgi:crossover junction endodeoxyribonuclease RuvC
VARVLGVDPGSRVTGYGIIDVEGPRLRLVTCGCIAPKGEALVARLGAIFGGIHALVGDFEPHEVAIEQVFMHRNVQSALKLGQARGAAIVGATRQGLPLFEYSATQIKQATTGRGHAAKAQVQHMVRVLLGLGVAPASDAADALAVAITHSHHRETARRMEASGIHGAVLGRARRRRTWRAGGAG